MARTRLACGPSACQDLRRVHTMPTVPYDGVGRWRRPRRPPRENLPGTGPGALMIS